MLQIIILFLTSSLLLTNQISGKAEISDGAESKAQNIQVPLEEWTLEASDSEQNIKLYHNASADQFCLKNREAETESFLELETEYDDIVQFQISQWGEETPWAVLQVRTREDGYETFIFDKENLNEIPMSADPMEMAGSFLRSEIDEEGNLVLNIAGRRFLAETKDAPFSRTLQQNLSVKGYCEYFQDETGLYCSAPVYLGRDNRLGNILLSFEFDGIGMNLTNYSFAE